MPDTTAYTKTVSVPENWLEFIDGLTVAQAIAYLQTLNPGHTLICYLTGDTHGADIKAELQYKVPMSNSEILAQHSAHYTKEIGIYEKALQDHIAAGRTSRAESCERRLETLRAKWAEIQAKYS